MTVRSRAGRELHAVAAAAGNDRSPGAVLASSFWGKAVGAVVSEGGWSPEKKLSVVCTDMQC